MKPPFVYKCLAKADLIKITLFGVQCDRHAAWECSRIRSWRTLLFRFLFKICKKTLVLYIFRTPSLRPCWTPKGTSKIQKRAPRCMRTLRQKTKRAPRCMGTLFEHSRSRMVAQDGFPQIAQSIYFKRFGTLFRQDGQI